MSEKKEYIERRAFSDYLREQARMDMRRMVYYEGIISMMNSFPAADVEPVVRGEWVDTDYKSVIYQKCSVCGRRKSRYEDKFERCPSCGAHMKRSGSGE